MKLGHLRTFLLIALWSVVLSPLHAAGVIHSLTTTGATNWSSGTWTNGVPNNTTTFIGDIAAYDGSATGTTTLDVDVTLGVIRDNVPVVSGWTISSDGTHAFTLNGTGLINNAATGNPFGIAGEAAIVHASGSTPFVVNPNIIMSTTNLGVGNTSNAPITLSGSISATSALTLNIRGNGSGGVNLNGMIGGTGSSAITIANVGTNSASVVLGSTGALGANVSSFSQNSATSAVTLAASLVDFTGSINLSAGSLTLTGIGPASGNALSMVAGTTLTLSNTTNASSDRITGNIVLGKNGAFNLNGNGATASITEAVSSLKIEAGNSTVTLGGSGTGRVVTLAASDVTRTGNGTALIRGSSLGTTISNSTRVTVGGTLGTGLTLIGTTTSNLGAVTTGTDKQLSLVPYFIGSSSASGVGTNFLTYDTNATTGGLRLLATGEQSLISSGTTNDNVKTITGDNAVSSGAKVFNSLLIGAGTASATPATTAASVTGAGGIDDTLTITSGALANVATGSAGSGSIGGFSSIIFGTTGANEAIITNTNASAGGELTIGSAINTSTAGGGLTKTGAGTVIFVANNLYTGATLINQGTLQVGSGGTTGNLGLGIGSVYVGAGATLSSNRSDAFTVNSVTGSGTIASNNALGTLTLNQIGDSLTLAAVTAVQGATLVFSGDGTGVTTLGKTTNSAPVSMQTAGATYKFTNGTVNMLDSGRGMAGNIELNGGVLNYLTNTFQQLTTNAALEQTLTITGGQLNVTAGFGVKGLNSNGGTTQSGLANSIFTGLQTGGQFNVTTPVSGNNQFALGSTSGGQTSSYTLSGGTLNYLAGGTFAIGADTAGTSTSTFTLSGGKLISNTTIKGEQSGSARQAFVWTGGILATSSYDSSNLTSVSAAAYSGNVGTLTNGGGTLAPGDIGTVGKTLITGRYQVSSPNAALAIDIGGTTAASVFQEAPASSKFDTVQVNGTGTAILGGKLNVSLVDSFTPTNANTFKIVSTASAGRSGTFANTAAANGGGVRVALANGLSSFLVTYNTADVTLGGYLADNQWSAASGSNWSASNSWTAFTPSLAGHIAKFGNTPAAGAVAINLDANETVRDLQFNSTTRNYTISSGTSNTLTLDNNGSASTISAVGTQIINVALALNNSLSLNVSDSTDALAINGPISGTSRSIVKGGLGALTLSGNNTYTGLTEVKSGTLNLAGNLASTLTIDPAGKLVIDGNRSVAGATFMSGATVNLDIASASSFDSLTSAGAVAFNGTLNLNFTASFTGNTTIKLFESASYAGNFTSIIASGAYSGSFTSGSSFVQFTTLDGGTLTFNNAKGDLSYSAAAIPEPATTAALAALIIGLTTFGLRRRSRRV